MFKIRFSAFNLSNNSCFMEETWMKCITFKSTVWYLEGPYLSCSYWSDSILLFLIKRDVLSCPSWAFIHTRKFSPPTGGFFLAPAEGCSLRLQTMGHFGPHRSRIFFRKEFFWGNFFSWNFFRGHFFGENFFRENFFR